MPTPAKVASGSSNHTSRGALTILTFGLMTSTSELASICNDSKEKLVEALKFFGYTDVDTIIGTRRLLASTQRP